MNILRTFIIVLTHSMLINACDVETQPRAATAVAHAPHVTHPDAAVSAQSTRSYLAQILYNPELRAQISLFLDNVLRQIPANDFFSLIDAIKPVGTDADIYQTIMRRLSSIMPYAPIRYYRQLMALKHQKQVVGTEQTQTLIGDTARPIRGVVEIGSPGTYTATIQNPITGPRYVVNDAQSITDRLHGKRIGQLPYDTFVPLNNYEPLSATIPDNSVDVVICYVGLHHVPEEKLNAFVRSIRRVLRPGGMFLLRDHDVTSPELLAIVHAAHSTFNAIMTGETVKTEMNEYRNFRELQHWINIVEKWGFEVGPERLLQEGDPTLNTMIKCTKVAWTVDEKSALVADSLQKNATYVRSPEKTYLNGTEWYNVDAAKELGAFLQNNNAEDFPHLQFLKHYWAIMFQATKVAAREQGWWKTITSEYTKDSLFIGSTMTGEYLFKSLWYLPSKLIAYGTKKTDCQKTDAQIGKDYGAFLDHTPWYLYPHFARAKEYAKTMGLNRRDIVLAPARITECIAKGIVAYPVAKMCENTAPQTIQLLIQDPDNIIGTVDKRIEVISTFDGGAIKLIQIPRYMQFLDVMNNIARTSAEFYQIAGNDKVQCKIRYKSHEQAPTFNNARLEYTWKVPTQPQYTYASVTVHVSALKSTINTMNLTGVELLYIHDF